MDPRIPSTRSRRRGIVLLGAVILFLVLAFLAATGTAVLSGGQQGFLVSSESTLAFYAADSGIEMALKEAYAGADLDGDGTVGGISSDGNDANDPRLDGSTIRVDFQAGLYTSTGNHGAARRRIEVVTQ
jgi:Tfp pilus assembly protein PilX